MDDLLGGFPAGLNLPNIGAGALVVLTVLAIMRGWLVPGRQVDRLMKIHEDRLAEEKARGDEWRSAAAVASARNDELTRQVAQLQEVGRTTLGMIEGMKMAVEQRGRAGR